MSAVIVKAQGMTFLLTQKEASELNVKNGQYIDQKKVAEMYQYKNKQRAAAQSA